MNPFQNPMQELDEFGLPKVDTEKEMWEKNSDKQKQTITLSFVALIILFVFILLTVIFGFIYKTENLDSMKSYYQGIQSSNPTWTGLTSYINSETNWYTTVINALFTICAILFVAAFVYFVITYFKSLKEQSFRYLTNAQNWFLALFGLLLFLTGVSTRPYVLTNGSLTAIMFWISFALTIGIYIYPLRSAGKIRRYYIQSNRISVLREQLKQNPSSVNPVGNNPFNSLFGFGPQQNPSGQTQQNPFQSPNINSNAQKAEVEEKDAEPVPVADQFDDMSTDQLKEIADKLLVSGVSDMNRQELLKKIREIIANNSNNETTK